MFIELNYKFLAFASLVSGHGRMMNPPGRGSVWRVVDSNPLGTFSILRSWKIKKSVINNGSAIKKKNINKLSFKKTNAFNDCKLLH